VKDADIENGWVAPQAKHATAHDQTPAFALD